MSRIVSYTGHPGGAMSIPGDPRRLKQGPKRIAILGKFDFAGDGDVRTGQRAAWKRSGLVP